MKRLLCLLAAMAIMVGAFAACGNNKADNGNATSSGPAIDVSASSEQSSTIADTVTYPLKIKDANGFELTLDKKPVKIASLALVIDEMLFSMVDRAHIASITTYSEDAGISNIAGEAASFPVKTNADAEKIIAMKPDLVILADWQKKEFIQQLRDAKIPVYQYKSPVKFYDLRIFIRQIAELVGEKARGEAMVDELDAALKSVNDKVKGIKAKDKKTVLFYNTYDGSTYGKGTSQDDIAYRAGVVNAASKAGMKQWQQLSKEQIIKLDPDIIIFPSWSYDKSKDPKSDMDNFMKDKGFAGLKAVKNKMVVMLQDKHLQTNSQYMAYAVKDLAEAAYPELFNK